MTGTSENQEYSCKGGHRAARTCLGCRGVFPQDQLVRFVLSPQGELLVDYRGKLPGRGAYTCIRQECIQQAATRKQFQRSFRAASGEIDVKHLLVSLKDQIFKRILGLLGMARKSSQMVVGTQSVISGMESGKIFRLLFLATDMSEEIAAKTRYKAGLAGIPCHSFFDKGTMGQISGKGECSVIAVRTSPLAEAVGVELARLKQISGES